MVQIEWTELAVNDLKNIYDYIRKDSERYAKIQVVRLRVRTKILKKFPLSGRYVPEFKNETFRELIEGSYRIIYKIISATTIHIITIHHSSRNLSAKMLE